MNTTGSLTQEMMTFLDKDFLEKSLQLNPHREGFKLKTQKQNMGKVVNYTRQDIPAVGSATTGLTEGTTPTAIDLTDNTVAATITQYGRHTVVTDLLGYTSVDEAANEKKDTMAVHAANVADTLARELMFTGSTVQYAANRAGLSSITASDLLIVAEVRKAVRSLKKNNAIPYEDGFFLGKIGPDTSFDLMNDSVWINAHTYKDGDNLYQGEVGKLHRVRFLECSANQKHETSTVEVYSNFIHGQSAFGALNLAGTPKAPQGETDPRKRVRNMQLIIKQDTANNDTSNPLSLYFTIGWKFFDAVATLNALWSINIKTAVSA